jgi:peptide/nickel transport system permease protein
MAIAWRKPSFRIGLVVLGLLVLVAVYAPFIATEAALLHAGRDGLGSPALADLFNRRSYPAIHDYLFNVLAVTLPFLGLGWALMRGLRRSRRLAWCVLAFLAVAGLGTLPIIPGEHGWRAVWSERPATVHTSVAAHAAAEADGWSLFAPVPHRWDATYSGAVLVAPGTENRATGAGFWLGTDAAGHDVTARMAFGARISLTIGLVATGIALAIGVVIGAVSGYFGGRIDLVLQRLVEIMMCFPTFILIITVVAMLDRNIFIIVVVIGLTGWAGNARLVRGEFLSQGARDYVRAAESLGLSRRRIMFRHILPNIMAPLMILATFEIAGTVLMESGLAFLGLGDPNAASWGTLLNQGRENITFAWLIYAPGIAVFLLVTALNLVGNGLREAFDPKAGG